MKIIPIIFSLIISVEALSQKLEVEFGNISAREIEMTSYDMDQEAKAVVLFDIGKSIFYNSDNGYDIRFTRHKRIKIFDKNAKSFSEISIPYFVDGYGKTEVIKSIEAITYNSENGKLITKKLSPSSIYDERINENWFNKKFVFPDVQEGSILEFIYVLETPFHFNLPDWVFQDKIPTIYSEYEVNMIPFYEYVFLVQGISKFDYQNSEILDKKREWGSVTKSFGKNVGSGVEFQDYRHTYVLKDIPAFLNESYITSINDYIIKMDFQLAKFHSPRGGSSNIISTWNALNKTLLKHENFGKYLKSSAKFSKNIIKNELVLEGLDKRNQSKLIIEYVKNNFKWNGNYSKYASQKVKDFINKKNGNIADINLFLIALLNEAGIEAIPLILSTRNHGKIQVDYPYDHFTNYVIAFVDMESQFLADGSENLLPYNRVPTRCLNEKGLLVDKQEEPSWVGLKSTSTSWNKNIITHIIDPLSLNSKTKILIQSSHYEAFSDRRKFMDDTIKIKDFYSVKIGSINKTTTGGFKNTERPYSIQVEANIETEKLGDNIVIKPFLDLPLSTNILSQKKRNYPVDFIYQWDRQFESVTKLPTSYTLTEIPKSYYFNEDIAEINLNYTYSEGTLTAKGNYKIKKAVYSPEEYPKIKNCMDQIVKLFNQPVVFELKK